ncbi:MAG: diguanylate cyclase (GGDEF)-like protein [Methylophilaceae bacterium]|jgi:diguanylate cyclase (GGDEF)-like protein
MNDLQDVSNLQNLALTKVNHDFKTVHEDVSWNASKKETKAPTHAEKPDNQESAQTLTEAKLMIVSDDSINAEVMRDYLITFGYRNIILTDEILGAFDIIFQEGPDAVLYDNTILTASDFSVLEQIRNNSKTRLIPLLILTNEADQSVKLKALELGVVEVIIKPAFANELSLRLRNILSIKTYHDLIANFDGVTKLPNRETFAVDVDLSLKYAQRYKTIGAVLQIGLTRFQKINAAYGISVGDQVLKTVALRIKEALRQTDVISRIHDLGIETTISRSSNDEFSLLLPTIEKVDDAAIVSLRLHENITKPYLINGQELHLDCNVGIAIFPDDGDRKDLVLHNASGALDQAKENSQANYIFFSKELNTLSTYRITMENNLRKALDLKQFEMYYQPKISLATKKIVGAEALIRWRHPTLGFISPEEFIPIAEESGNILALGRWIINTVTQQIRDWQSDSLTVPRVALNVSGLQLKHFDLLSEVESALNKANINANQITIEITETSVLDNTQEIVSALNALKALGAKVSIDDFGTGYSSLIQLKQLPLDEIKIDRTFIMDVGLEKNSEAIILATLAMAHSLNFNVVAEGVETEEQFNFLLNHGCNEYQGYLFSPAVSAKEFGALVA